MANQIVQKLIAAGASPQKAQSFAKQYIAQTTKAGIKPKDIQDAFDAEIAAFAAAAYPNTFKPPSITDPRIRDYVIGAYGSGVLDTITDKSFSYKAPDLDRILLANPNLENTPDNKLGLDAYIVKQLYFKQMPIGELKDILSNPARQTELGISSVDPKTKVTKLITGSLLPADYNSLVEKYSAQDAAQQEEEQKQLESFLNSDKYYKVGLVTPKIKYGKTEDLAAGIIDYKTHPSVAKYINQNVPKLKSEDEMTKQIALTPAAGYIGAAGPEAAKTFSTQRETARNAPSKAVAYEDDLFNRFVKSGAKPFVDEVKRRESLKKTTTLGK
jgi:hypothetical protein